MVRTRTWLAVPLVVGFGATCGVAQTIVSQVPGTAAGGRFGHAVDVLSDLDGDGVPELVVGAPLAAPGGQVSVLATEGTVHWQVAGAAGERFGHAVAVLGDVDGDGIEDVAVGAPLAANAAGQVRGRVDVLCGSDGSLLYSILGMLGNDELGFAVCALGDVDGDGVDDLAVGAPGALGERGYVRGYSGVDGAFRFARFGQFSSERFGHSLTGMDDVDGDGVGDLVAGGPFVPASPFAGVVRAVSGSNGFVLWSAGGDAAGDAFGTAVAALDDVDADGSSDVLVGAPQDASGTGWVRVLAGSGGATVTTLAGTEVGSRFGASVRALGDVDGDGASDIAIGAPLSAAGAADAGEVGLYAWTGASIGSVSGTQPQEHFGTSLAVATGIAGAGPGLAVGAPGTVQVGPDDGSVQLVTPVSASMGPQLSADVTSVSLSAKDSQILTLDAGPELSGRFFVVLGSASGTDPGLSIGSFTLPLVPDRYLRLTLFWPHCMLRPARGRLDADGRATIAVRPHPRFGRRLVGQTLHHAVVLLERRAGIVGVTDAVPVTITR